jgi:hypothetical protein
MPCRTAEEWIVPFRSGGLGAVMGANGKRMYSYGTKLAAVRDCRRSRYGPGPGHGEIRYRGQTAGRPLVRRLSHRWPRDAASETAGRAKGSKPRAQPGVCGRSCAAQPGRVFAGEGRPPGKTPGPAGAENVTNQQKSRMAAMPAGRYRPAGSSKAAGPARSTYCHERSHPDRIGRTGFWTAGRYDPASHGERPRAPRIRTGLIHGFGMRVSAKSVPEVMCRMGSPRRIQARNPWKHYSSYQGDRGQYVHSPPERDFKAGKPRACPARTPPGFRVANTKTYLAPIYDTAGKEIIARGHPAAPRSGAAATAPGHAWSGSRPRTRARSRTPIRGRRHRHRRWRRRPEELGIRRSMSRKRRPSGRRRHRTGVRPSPGTSFMPDADPRRPPSCF